MYIYIIYVIIANKNINLIMIIISRLLDQEEQIYSYFCVLILSSIHQGHFVRVGTSTKFALLIFCAHAHWAQLRHHEWTHKLPLTRSFARTKQHNTREHRRTLNAGVSCLPVASLPRRRDSKRKYCNCFTRKQLAVRWVNGMVISRQAKAKRTEPRKRLARREARAERRAERASDERTKERTNELRNKIGLVPSLALCSGRDSSARCKNKEQVESLKKLELGKRRAS